MILPADLVLESLLVFNIKSPERVRSKEMGWKGTEKEDKDKLLMIVLWLLTFISSVN